MKRVTPTQVVAATVAVWLGLWGSASGQTVLRVRADAVPGGDGTSWGSAFSSLEAALDAGAPLAQAGTAVEIWVAAGTYRPSEQYRPPWNHVPAFPEAFGTGPRTETFRLANRVSLYGGFVGTEASRSHRDISANPTVLSGDLNGDDGPAFTNTADNAFHVVTAVGVDGTARLDGFTIRGANVIPQVVGGPNSVFNLGGGMVNLYGASPMVANCTFIANRNQSDTYGGGAMMNWWHCNPTIVNCSFLGNHAVNAGGAVWSWVDSAPLFVQCLFSGNAVGPGTQTSPVGGAVVDAPACPSGVSGCGPVRSARYINCTFANNSSTDFAGAAFGFGPGPPVFENCVFWGNTSGVPSDDSWHFGWIAYANWYQVGIGPPPVLRRSCIQSSPQVFAATDCFVDDPRFVSVLGPDGVPGTLDDDLRLTTGSPCVDAGSVPMLALDLADLDADGDTGEPLPLDLRGSTRRIDDPASLDRGAGAAPQVDLGAFEASPSALASVWTALAGGAFGSPENWSPGPPAAASWAVFPSSGAPYVVTSSGDVQISRLLALGAPVTLDLGGGGLTATFAPGESVFIDGTAETPGLLDISNGGLLAGGITIGRPFGPAASTLSLNGPAQLVQVTGEVRVEAGRLRLMDGPTVVASGFSLGALGAIDGSGLLTGTVRNAGSVRPGTPVDGGTITVSGLYRQWLPGVGSGSLEVDVSGPSAAQIDRLVVNGAAELSGFLRVTLANGYVPQPADSIDVEILSPTTRAGRFDVALLPGLADGRYFRVVYNGLRGPGAGVSLQLAPLPGGVGFSPPNQNLVNGSPTGVAVGDLNGDGLPDLAITVPDSADPTDAPGSLVLLFNAGIGPSGWLGFSSSTQITLVFGASQSRQPSAVAIADLDGLPGLDVAITGASSGNLLLLKNSGTGTFTLGAELLVPPTPGFGSSEPRALAAGNMDRVNGTDLLLADATGDRVHLYFNQGGGAAYAFIPFPTPVPVGRRPVSIDPFDSDGDKDLDIAVVGQVSGNVSFLRNISPPGGFAPSPTQSLPVGEGPVQIVSGDLNGDSRLDLVTVNQAGNTVSVLVNAGNNVGGEPSFAPQVELPVGSGPTSLVRVDLDQDNDLDLAVLAVVGGTPQAQVLRNDTNGGQQLQFAPATSQPAGTQPLFLVSADVDTNGRADLVAVNAGSLRLPPPQAEVRTIPNNSTPPCPADWDRNGLVQTADVATFITDWFDSLQTTTLYGDFDRNNRVESVDVGAFVNVWFTAVSAGC